MCFSATASFIAAFVLLIIGIAAIKINKHPRFRLFSYIPLLFSIQQFSEGILWLTLENDSYHSIQSLVTYLFIIFALVIWPVFISLALLPIEKHKGRRNILKLFLILGTLCSLYFLYIIFTNDISASIIGNHIIYNLPIFNNNLARQLIYFIIIVGPFFATHIRSIMTFGTLVSVSGIVAYFIWSAYLTSVWCFFGALVSTFVLYMLHKKKLVDVA